MQILPVAVYSISKAAADSDDVYQIDDAVLNDDEREPQMTTHNFSYKV